jgi:hypothetical protein
MWKDTALFYDAQYFGMSAANEKSYINPYPSNVENTVSS